MTKLVEVQGMGLRTRVRLPSGPLKLANPNTVMCSDFAHLAPLEEGLDVIQQGNIRITSIEQTVVDSIRDFEKIAGLEEVIRCMMLVPTLNEKKVLDCLARNNNGYLYQKCGYVFEEMRQDFHFSDEFFVECERCISGANKYLQKDLQNTVFHERWKLYAPSSLKELIDKGVGDYDAIG